MELTPDCETRQYVAFGLDSARFALAVSRVRGVLDVAAVNRVFDGHECVRGVVNLGGNIAPVVDLRPRLAGGGAEAAADTCVIVAEVDPEAERTVLGILAGGACEVVSLGPSEAGPRTLGERPSPSETGLVKTEGGSLRLLDLDSIFAREELGELKARYHYAPAPARCGPDDFKARVAEYERRVEALIGRYPRGHSFPTESSLLRRMDSGLRSCAAALRTAFAAPLPRGGEKTGRETPETNRVGAQGAHPVPQRASGPAAQRNEEDRS